MDAPETLAPLLRDRSDRVVMAAARALQAHTQAEGVLGAMNRSYVIARDRADKRALTEQLEFNLYPDPGCCLPTVTDRPGDYREWTEAVLEEEVNQGISE